MTHKRHDILTCCGTFEIPRTPVDLEKLACDIEEKIYLTDELIRACVTEELLYRACIN